MVISFGFIYSSSSLYRGDGDIYFDSIAMVLFLVMASRFLLDTHLKKVFSKNISHCLPGVFQARVLRDGRFIEVSPLQIKQGERVLVRQGEQCPVDGIIDSPQAIVDTSVLTGESLPQVLNRGEKIYAGSRLALGECEVDCLAVGEKTNLGSIINTSLKSIKPSNIENFSYISWFTLTLLLLSLSVFGLFLVQGQINMAFQRSLAMILVACPCALSFGFPLIRLLSMSLSLKEKILVKNPGLIPSVRKASHIYFDKTGTLTQDKIHICAEDFLAFPELDQKAILALELSMEHPISKGFQVWRNKFDELPEVEFFKYIPSKGIEGRVYGVLYKVLSHQHDKQKYLDIYKNGSKLGSLRASSSIRESTPEIFNFLAKKMIPISIVSGDNEQEVLKIWQKIPGKIRGHAISSANPLEKKKMLEKAGEYSLMVGDGINDVAAMGKAQMSIAMPGPLEDNIKASDFALLKGDLNLIKALFQISQKVYLTEKRVLIFTALYNFSCLVLAAFGFINPLMAAILMPISSFCVLTLIYTHLGRAPWK